MNRSPRDWVANQVMDKAPRNLAHSCYLFSSSGYVVCALRVTS